MFLILVVFAPTKSQINRFNGEFRYQSEYQRYSREGITTNSLAHIPMFYIGTSGALIDPAIFSFDIRTNLGLSVANSGTGEFSTSTKSFQWNYYDLSVNLLQNAPVLTGVRLNDMVNDISASSASPLAEHTKLRKQEQALRLTTNHISFLPQIDVNMGRTHSWSLSGPSMLEQFQYAYGFNMASGGQRGSVNISGSLSDNSETFTGAHLRYYNLTLQSARNISEWEHLDIGANYNKYGDNTDIDANIGYFNAQEDKPHFGSSVSGRSSSGPSYHLTGTSFNQSFQYTQDEHLRYHAGLNGTYGHDAFYAGNAGVVYKNYGGGMNGGVTHSRSFGAMSMSNGLSFGYGLNHYADLRSTVSISLSNALQAQISTYKFGISHSLAMSALRDGRDLNTLRNGLKANFSGDLVHRVHGQVITTYNSEVYTGDSWGYGNRRDLSLQWYFSSPLYYRIPFSVGFSGSVNWYFAGAFSRMYTWSATFSSGQFFDPALSLNYALSRAYDVTYRRASISHSLGANYQWRSIAMQLQLNNYQLDHNQTQVLLSLVRPF